MVSEKPSPRTVAPRGGHDVEGLPFLGIGVIAPRHSQVTQDKLRKEGQVEPGEDEHDAELGRPFRVHAPGHFGPPKCRPQRNPMTMPPTMT